jgi:small subunit ribosomal protein S15Ae
MVRVSVLNDALKSMYNAEKRKRQVMIRPSSKVIIKFIVMQKHGKFLKSFTVYAPFFNGVNLNYCNYFKLTRTNDDTFLTAGYIGEFEFVDDHRSGKIVVELNGRLNKCGVISPRFDVGVKEIESWTARLLPSRQASSRK